MNILQSLKNHFQRQKMNGKYLEKSPSKENFVSELDIEVTHDVVHDVYDDKKYEAIAGMKLNFPSPFSCSRSRNWLRIFMEEIDKHIFLKQKVKENQYHILNF